jgi:hypothetical protein
LLSRLFRLSKSEVLLLLEAVGLVAAVRIALWIWPYDRVRAYLGRRQSLSEHRQSLPRVVQFISAVSRYVPGANCLTRALAAEALLRRHGHAASLQIGVSKNNSDRLQAHAWVESGGIIVMGGDEVEGLTPLRAAVMRPRQ